MDMSNNFTDIDHPILAAVIGIGMVTGLVANFFVLVLTFCFIKDWKQPAIIFLTNMLLNNLVIILLVMPFSIITAASGEWIFGSTVNQKESVCQFAAFMRLYSYLSTLESLMLVSFDRFFFIVKALQYDKYMTVNKAVIIVAISWILAAIITVIPVVGFGDYEYINSHYTCMPTAEHNIGYSIIIFVCIFTFIVSIIVTTIWTLCFTRKYLRDKATGPVPIDTQGSNVYASQQRRIIGLFGMLILVHLFCYAPSWISQVTGFFTTIPPVLYTLVYILYLLLASLNPLVQSFFRRDIREAVVKCGESVCAKRSIITSHNS